jgi:membrane protease YdiL (CAAX protease family)
MTEPKWGRFAAFAAIGGAIGSSARLLRYVDAPWWARACGGVIGLVIVLYGLRYARAPRWLRKITIDQWRAIDAETERDPAAAGTTSLTVFVVLLTVAISLTLQEYIGDRGYFERMFPPRGHGVDTYWELEGFAWWAGWRVFGYVGIPMIVLALVPGQRIRDYHVSPRGFFKHLWIYVVLFCGVLPAVIAASTTSSFRHTYPFYRMANRSFFDLACWEGLYWAQFVALEFFFRGFILQGLRRALGANAIFVMIVPYCMIHYGKPMPETFGAIGAGLILGTLAMRTKSIWGGVLIHIGVATTMDVLALRGCPPFGSGHWCGE